MNFPITLSQPILDKANQLNILPQDIEEKFITGSGKGGQKINKTASCVLLKHKPTGLVIKCQKHREQWKNRISAYKLLINKIDAQLSGAKSVYAQRIFKLRKQKQKRSKRAQEKILADKQHNSVIKKQRKKVDPSNES